MINPELIVDLSCAVDADADFDMVPAEHLGPSIVQQRRVGLQAELDANDVFESIVDSLAPAIESLDTDQGGFTPVERHIYSSLARPQALPSGTLDRAVKDVIGHDGRPTPPRVISLVVNITIGAVEIAVGGDLVYDLKSAFRDWHGWQPQVSAPETPSQRASIDDGSPKASIRRPQADFATR